LEIVGLSCILEVVDVVGWFVVVLVRAS